jgi:tetratricopeptide (TPR) repeat protein
MHHNLKLFRRNVHFSNVFFNRLRLFTTSSEEIDAREEATKVWNKGLKLAEKGDPTALCDIGWGFHQGKNPHSIKSIDKAMDYYLKSATLGYSPAASLLADIHYYEHDDKKDWPLAQKYLEEVIELTVAEAEGDAYLRAKTLQKLGIIEYHEKNVHKSLEHFRTSLELCSKHLGGSYAFLLNHDPPGLFEQLENEIKLLKNDEVLGRVMSDLVNVGQGETGDGSALSQLQYYTRELRTTENDPEWVLQFTMESLDVFGGNNNNNNNNDGGGGGGGEWGITYFTSSLRIFMEPIVQHCLKRGHGNHGQVPKMVGLGSALGNTIVWPAIAFGFRGVCFDILPSCTNSAKELYQNAADAIERKNKIFKQYQNVEGGDGGDGSHAGHVHFETMDVIHEINRVKDECKDANIVWINDFSWSIDSQKKIEKNVYDSLPSNSVMILYRPPHYPPPNVDSNEGSRSAVAVINVATSWNPNLEMHIVLKV